MDGVTMFWKDWCTHSSNSQLTGQPFSVSDTDTMGLLKESSMIQTKEQQVRSVGRKPLPPNTSKSQHVALKQSAGSSWKCVKFPKKSAIKAWYLFSLDVGLLTSVDTARSFCHQAWPELDHSVRERYRALERELKSDMDKTTPEGFYPRKDRLPREVIKTFPNRAYQKMKSERYFGVGLNLTEEDHLLDIWSEPYH